MISGTSAAKLTDVYQYLDDGTKKQISYEQGVKLANQGTSNIQFTGDDLIKALETGALDEFRNDQEETRRLIEEEKKKMENQLTEAEMKEASKPENTINVKLNE